jgi:hypothetical protein
LLLKSAEELFAARDAGLVVLQKTDIVLNCPVIYTPFGGQLQTVKIGLSDGDKRDRNLAPNGQFTTQAGAIIESPRQVITSLLHSRQSLYTQGKNFEFN